MYTSFRNYWASATGSVTLSWQKGFFFFFKGTLLLRDHSHTCSFVWLPLKRNKVEIKSLPYDATTVTPNLTSVHSVPQVGHHYPVWIRTYLTHMPGDPHLLLGTPEEKGLRCMHTVLHTSYLQTLQSREKMKKKVDKSKKCFLDDIFKGICLSLTVF